MSAEQAHAYLVRDATLSPCGRYRYELRHRWEDRLPPLVIGCLNPSTADEFADDPTVRKIRGFAERLGCGAFVLWNLYAYRATHPRNLFSAHDPVGPEADLHLMHIYHEAHKRGGRLVVGWGANALPDRVGAVARLLKASGLEERVECWGFTANGEPRHPLMLAYATPLEPWPCALRLQ